MRFETQGPAADRSLAEVHVSGVPVEPDSTPLQIPRFRLECSAPTVPQAAETAVDVNFTDAPGVPKPFRGRTVTTGIPLGTRALDVNADDVILAECAVGPIWTRRMQGAHPLYRSSLPFPEVAAADGFSDVFGGKRFLSLLALISFLREAQGEASYRGAPLRASFIIDDPNLHWPRYGFVDYRRLADQAEDENYHLSFATIPLDTWFTHGETADLFRNRAARLSLLVHGNNHAKAELAQPCSTDERRALLGQALRRVERVERKANLRISRVMVPPHGACSSEMLSELGKSGFESACISTGSLRSHNSERTWARSLGYRPVELIEGCAVMPRWGLSGETENSLLVAAFLGQAMVLRGHHQDFKRGTEVFDRYARFINGLGDVRWGNMTDISRAGYLWRMEGALCRVVPLSPIIKFPVPPGASRLKIDDWNSLPAAVWQVCGSDGLVRTMQPSEALPVEGDSAGTVCIERARRESGEQSSGPDPAISARLVLRRVLTEARDRLQAL